MNDPDAWTIRPATADDAPGIAAVLRNCWPDDTPELGRIARLAGYADHALRVAWRGGKLLGVVDAFPTVGATGALRWEIDLLAVHAAARGQGVGRQLISAAVAVAPRTAALSRGLIRIDNVPSEAVFRAAGFQMQVQPLALFTAKPASGPSEAVSYSHIVPVESLLYRGLWVEGAPSAAALLGARVLAAGTGADVVGMLVAQDSRQVEDCDAAGFRLVGVYRWWARALATDSSAGGF